MKKSFQFFISVLLLSIATSGWAQKTSRFPIQPTSVWRVDSVDATWNIVENSRFFIHGDTTIGTNNFYKLYKSGVAQYNTPFYYNNVYVGAIRDYNNQIFFIKRKKSSEALLFDFNLNVGDTIKSMISKGKKIIDIDTLPNGRRIFYHGKDHYNLGYIIEGIGANGGLFSSGSSFIILHSGELANYLICYAEDDMLVYESEVGRMSNCDVVNKDNEFSINPSSIWRIDCDSVSPHSEKYQYYINGDTLIDQIIYFKLFKKGFYLARNQTGEYISTYKNDEYVGSIRDYDRKYFFVKPNQSSEILLYDFNLKVGEKATCEIYKGENVYAIDTAFDNRRRYYFSNDRYSKVVIEGIGSTHDFLDEGKSQAYLRCFSVNDVPVYHLPAVTDCRLDTKTTTFPICNQLQVWPQIPTNHDNISIEFASCLPVPFGSNKLPKLTSYEIFQNEHTFDVNLFYINDNESKSDDAIIPFAVFDTLSIGKLEEGQYNINCHVYAIKGNSTDGVNLTNYSQMFWVWPSVSSSVFIPDKTDVQLFPNPASDNLKVAISGSVTAEVSYQVIDIFGRIIITGETGNGCQSFDIETKQLTNGLYLLRINIRNIIKTFKFKIIK